MQALVFDPAERNLSFIPSKPIPVISNPDDVIVKIAYSGVCGTDLHIFEGEYPTCKKPLVLGHESCGTVHAIGKEVKDLKVGDRVALDPQSVCYSCEFCREGSPHLCPNNLPSGIFCDGGWAEFCKVSQKQVYVLPHGLSLEKAMLCEPLSCICHGLNRISPVPIGSRILVNGAGIIGNLFCSALHFAGHRDVYVSEPNSARQELNKKSGTGFVVGSPDYLEKQCSELGIDLCIDCSGNAKALEFGMKLLNKGGKLLIFGVAAPETKISVHPFEIYQKELTIYGAALNRFSFQQAIDMMNVLDSWYLDYNNLGIRRYSLKEYKEALNTLKQGEISKVVFVVNEE
ncbi:hypothetical protein LSTR_LSTR003834 [Laodelphax striatellus]|uniref:Enoyl reductase (ER) domain-containing protein n=1 Tax=Laodelphax striatellus TaxID=195883 RepID=A0A482XE77_LAOST|nr:hypothetical protein LSTR_LSTR003834 [Laodelphax striatellus]